MASACNISNSRCRGFTLLELVIAVGLIGMVMLLAYSGMRVALRSWSQAETTIRVEEELRLVHGLLWRQLSQAHISSHQTRTASRSDFTGTPRRLEFTAPAPGAHASGGGHYRYVLEFVPDENGNANLRLSYAPAASSFRPNGKANTRILVEQIKTGGFAYFGAADALHTAAWHDHWQQQSAPPRLVRVGWSRADTSPAWPDLVIPIMAGGQG